MTWLAIKAAWSTWRPALLGAAVVAAPCFLLGQCAGAVHEKDRQEAAAAVATVEALKTDGAAKEKAAGERLADAEAVADLKEELTDAVADLPDDEPSARRVALGCARLRNQGQDTTRLPACGGSAGQAQAPTGP